MILSTPSALGNDPDSRPRAFVEHAQARFAAARTLWGDPAPKLSEKLAYLVPGTKRLAFAEAAGAVLPNLPRDRPEPREKLAPESCRPVAERPKTLAADIAAAAHRRGRAVDERTIRRWLRESAANSAA